MRRCLMGTVRTAAHVTFENILFATDFSTQSERALQFAASELANINLWTVDFLFSFYIFPVIKLISFIILSST